MWEPRRLTTLSTSMACYRDSCTLHLPFFWRTVPSRMWCRLARLTYNDVSEEPAASVLSLKTEAAGPSESNDLPDCMASHIRKTIFIQRTDIAVTLSLEVLSSNLSRDTGYPDWSFCGIPQSLKPNTGALPRPAHDRFLPNSLKFMNDSAIKHCWHR
jgi:hypothetical protein